MKTSLSLVKIPSGLGVFVSLYCALVVLGSPAIVAAADFPSSSGYANPLGGVGFDVRASNRFDAKDYNGSVDVRHAGDDLYVPLGTPVYALADGTVRWQTLKSSNSSRDSSCLIIEHYSSSGQKFYAIYGHTRRLGTIATGTRVSRGQQIGTIGRWDRSSSHLHLGVNTSNSMYGAVGRAPLSGPKNSFFNTASSNPLERWGWGTIPLLDSEESLPAALRNSDMGFVNWNDPLPWLAAHPLNESAPPSAPPSAPDRFEVYDDLPNIGINWGYGMSWDIPSDITAFRLQISTLDARYWNRDTGWSEARGVNNNLPVNYVVRKDSQIQNRTHSYVWNASEAGTRRNQDGSLAVHSAPEAGRTYYYSIYAYDPRAGNGHYSTPRAFSVVGSAPANPGDDSYENNDSRSTATNFTSYAGRWLSRIGGYGIAQDSDYFRIEKRSTASTLTISLDFAHSGGDIDVTVLDRAGQTVGSSTTSSNDETITINSLSAGTYTIHVYPFGSPRANRYNLRWDELEPSTSTSTGSSVSGNPGGSVSGTPGGSVSSFSNDSAYGTAGGSTSRASGGGSSGVSGSSGSGPTGGFSTGGAGGSTSGGSGGSTHGSPASPLKENPTHVASETHVDTWSQHYDLADYYYAYFASAGYHEYAAAYHHYYKGFGDYFFFTSVGMTPSAQFHYYLGLAYFYYYAFAGTGDPTGVHYFNVYHGYATSVISN